MNGKSIGKALLFPPAAVLALLPPIAAALLVYSMAVYMIAQANRKLNSLEEAQWNTTTASK